MPKPSNLIAWATLPGTTLEPPEDNRNSGFAEGDRPPARWHNWLFNGAHQWVKYLDKLHEEADFLNKLYNWTNTHSFAGIFAKHDLGVHGEVLYVAEDGPPERRERSVMVPISFVSEVRLGNITEGGYDIPGWYYTTELADGVPAGWRMRMFGKKLVGTFRVPTGARLTRMVAQVWVGTGATVQMDAGLYSVHPLSGAAIPVTSSQIRTTEGRFDIDLTATLPADVVGALQLGYVAFSASGSGGHVGVQWVQPHFLDPGPRNF